MFTTCTMDLQNGDGEIMATRADGTTVALSPLELVDLFQLMAKAMERNGHDFRAEYRKASTS